MTNVTWLHAPGHAGSINKRVIEMAIDMDPTVIDWTEMYWNTDELAQAEGYHHLIGPVKRRDKRNRPVNHDVVLSVHSDAEIVHKESFFLCRQVTSNLKYMPERWGKAVVFDYEGVRVLLVAWHPHANPFRRIGLVLPLYRKSVERATKVQRRLEMVYKPDLVLNGGDLQLGPGRRWVYPNKMAERLLMQYKRHGIDWQMWRGSEFRLHTHSGADPKRVNPKMDHPWSLLSLNKKED